jgi:flagellar hook assembly protein FlgD
VCNGVVETLLGRGDGTFDSPVNLVPQLQFAWGSAAEDVNGDGNADLVVTDPLQNTLVVYAGDGRGGFTYLKALLGAGAEVAVGDLNSDGKPDMATAWYTLVGTRLNTLNSAAGSAQSRAFVLGDSRTVSTGGSADLCILVEPLQGSYTLDQLAMTSFTLSSEGTGSVSEIGCSSRKATVSADRDRNGIPEASVYFSSADLSSLFDHLSGRTDVTAELEGSLLDGRHFCSDVALTVQGKPAKEPQAVAFAPNPLNPSTRLSFATDREGPARARVFDLQGRLVRTILDNPRLPAGAHEFTFDGRTDAGTPLASGVYFYRVETVQQRAQGTIVILK